MKKEIINCLQTNNVELLSPAGTLNKLKTALHFGADAVYVGGKQFGLRAFAGNFSDEDLATAVKLCHEKGKKLFVTLNVFARNDDFKNMIKYVKYLDEIGIDAVIVSDMGVMNLVKENSNLEIHVSTQSNVVNKYTAMEYVKLGAKRIVLARELNLTEITEIAEYLKGKAEIEVFVHGAMCIAYSGRCLLSNYLTGRESNKGACVQACRWNYALVEQNRKNEELSFEEDSNGSYILNSKDLCLVNHIQELIDAGVVSFKIEGRMKSEYYVGTVTNAYRRIIDSIFNKKKINFDAVNELEKTSHRRFTTGFVFNEKEKEFYENSAPIQSEEFMAQVIEDGDGKKVTIEQRNSFNLGDELEVLSVTDDFQKTFKVNSIINRSGESIEIAKNVQEELILDCPYKLKVLDILRKKL